MSSVAIAGAIASPIAWRNAGVDEGGGVAMPQTGLAALWYADQAVTGGTRKYIPNEVTVGTVSPNLFLNDVTITPASWTKTNVTTTAGQTDDLSGTEAVKCVCTGAWVLRNDNLYNFSAGAHTLVIVAKSNTTAVDVKIGFGFTITSSGTQVTIGTSYTRVTHTQTMSSGSTNPVNIIPVTGDSDITIARWYIYEGSVDPYASTSETNGGHALLGTDAKTSVPTITANEVDLATARMQSWFNSAFSLGSTTGSFTLFACIAKTVSTAGTDRPSLFAAAASTAANSYGTFAAFASWNNAPAMNFPSFSTVGYRYAFSPGAGNLLFDPLNNGYNVWCWSYDSASTLSTIYLNGIPIAGEVSTPSLATFRGFFLGLSSTEAAKAKWNSGAYYSRALTVSEISTVSTVLQNKAVANGLSLDTRSRFVYFDGDSITQGNTLSSPGSAAYPYVYLPNASQSVYAFNFSGVGNKLAQVEARRTAIYSRLPSLGTRKAIYSCMIGTNDMTLSFTDTAANYSATLLSHFSAMKGYGYRTVCIGIIPRTDVNAASGMSTWKTTVNSNLRAAVGSQLDAFVDVEAISELTDSNNTTYFNADKVHLTAAGHTALEAAVRTAINSLL